MNKNFDEQAVQEMVRRWRFLRASRDGSSTASVSFWRRLLRLWIALGEKIGIVTSAIILTGVYVVLFAPMALAFFLMRKDLLNRSLDGKSFWQKKTDEAPTLERSRNQF